MDDKPNKNDHRYETSRPNAGRVLGVTVPPKKPEVSSHYLSWLLKATRWNPGHMALAFLISFAVIVQWFGGPDEIKLLYREARDSGARVVAMEMKKEIIAHLDEVVIKEQLDRQAAHVELLVQLRRTQVNLAKTYDLAAHINGGQAHVKAPYGIDAWTDPPLGGRRETFKTDSEWMDYEEDK